jgi:hypothetical protein
MVGLYRLSSFLTNSLTADASDPTGDRDGRVHRRTFLLNGPELTTFYNSGANDGNFLLDLDVCSRAVCSDMQSGNYRCDKS